MELVGYSLKMKKLLFVFGVFLFGLFIINLDPVSSVGETSYCCEQTIEGAWCQNVDDISKCKTGGGLNSPVPSSCESTSYCKLGTCINSQEGTCMENTPERVCQDNEGVWKDGDPEDLIQCQLGCCILGDQAAFVTQTRCNRLSSVYGLNINFRSDIRNEVACIASANPQEKGACVLDNEVERTCRLLTKEECSKLETTSLDMTIEFHAGFLCSDENLATQCGPSERTTCLEGKDEVWFLDTCGNLANIYDASKVSDKEYWSKIKGKEESCGSGLSNANSRSCGNCDYFLGSTCKAFERGNRRTTQPTLGNNVCADLSCEYKGDTFQHGETWCADSDGVDENLPGSRDFRLVCYDAEVSVEACADFRQEVCLQSDIDGFKTAACRANKWHECIVQDNKGDCEDSEKRDCKWLEGQTLALETFADNEGNLFVVNEDDELVKPEEDDERGGAACVPLYAPGFDFWNEETEAEELCLVASADCIVKFQKTPIIGSWGCVDNCECWEGSKDDGRANKDWTDQWNNICLALGDCGVSDNYKGDEGQDIEDVVVIESLNPSE